MPGSKIKLKEAVRFHGHLCPYLILGILAGEVADKKTGCRKDFGLTVKVWGAGKKPKSCLIDGLQLSTGATYGKGNIRKLNGKAIKIEFCNLVDHKKITLRFKRDLIQRLSRANSHAESERLARSLYGGNYNTLFKLTTHNRG